MIYLTGDTHGRFERIEHFCERMKTSKEDILIILGDAGINYYGIDDNRLKSQLSTLDITLFCIQGNDAYAQDVYEMNWLFEDGDADDTDCTFRQTSHIAAMLGTYITTYFTNFCSNLSPDNFPKRIPWFMEYNSIVNTYDFEY